MGREREIQLDKVLIVTQRDTYFDLLLLNALSQQKKRVSPVMADSIDLMERRILRWNPEIRYELFDNQQILCKKKEAEDLLGFKVGDWTDVNPIDVYSRIIEHKKINMCSNHHIFAFESEHWCALLAAIRAGSEGRPFNLIKSNKNSSEGLNKLVQENTLPSSAFFITDSLNNERAHWIHELVSSLNYSSRRNIFLDIIPYGFLSANDFEMMTFIDLKQRNQVDTAGQDVVILPSMDKYIENHDLSYSILNRGMASAEMLSEKQVQVFSLTAHGCSDLAFVGQDCLCGMSDKASSKGIIPNEKSPICAHPPYSCFWENGNKLCISELAAQHIFINSCGSMGLIDSEFGVNYNLSTTALEGRAESYVGTLRWKDGDIQESFLYLYALRAGYNLGETVVLINSCLKFSRYEKENDIFMLLGDPKCVIEHNTEDISTDIPIIEGVCASINVDKPFMQIFFLNEELARDYFDGSLSISIKGMEEGFYTVCPANSNAGKGILMMIINPSSTNIPFKCDIKLNRGIPEFQKAINAYNNISEQLDPALGVRKFYPQQVVKGIKNELDNRVLNLASLYKETYNKPYITTKIIQECERYSELVGHADEITCTYLQDKFSHSNFRFSEHYQDKFNLAFKPEPYQRCYMCGQSVVVRSQKHIIRQSSCRNEYICWQCGGIEDKPDNDFKLEIVGGMTSISSSKTTVDLMIINNTVEEQKGYCCVAVRNSSKWNMNVEPTSKPIIIKPLGRVYATFDLFLGNAPTHKLSLQAAFVSQQRVYLAMRPLWITL